MSFKKVGINKINTTISRPAGITELNNKVYNQISTNASVDSLTIEITTTNGQARVDNKATILENTTYIYNVIAGNAVHIDIHTDEYYFESYTINGVSSTETSIDFIPVGDEQVIINFSEYYIVTAPTVSENIVLTGVSPDKGTKLGYLPGTEVSLSITTDANHYMDTLAINDNPITLVNDTYTSIITTNWIFSAVIYDAIPVMLNTIGNTSIVFDTEVPTGKSGYKEGTALSITAATNLRHMTINGQVYTVPYTIQEVTEPLLITLISTEYAEITSNSLIDATVTFDRWALIGTPLTVTAADGANYYITQLSATADGITTTYEPTDNIYSISITGDTAIFVEEQAYLSITLDTTIGNHTGLSYTVSDSITNGYRLLDTVTITLTDPTDIYYYHELVINGVATRIESLRSVDILMTQDTTIIAYSKKLIQFEVFEPYMTGPILIMLDPYHETYGYYQGSTINISWDHGLGYYVEAISQLSSGHTLTNNDYANKTFQVILGTEATDETAFVYIDAKSWINTTAISNPEDYQFTYNNESGDSRFRQDEDFSITIPSIYSGDKRISTLTIIENGGTSYPYTNIVDGVFVHNFVMTSGTYTLAFESEALFIVNTQIIGNGLLTLSPDKSMYGAEEIVTITATDSDATNFKLSALQIGEEIISTDTGSYDILASDYFKSGNKFFKDPQAIGAEVIAGYQVLSGTPTLSTSNKVFGSSSLRLKSTDTVERKHIDLNILSALSRQELLNYKYWTPEIYSDQFGPSLLSFRLYIETNKSGNFFTFYNEGSQKFTLDISLTSDGNMGITTYTEYYGTNSAVTTTSPLTTGGWHDIHILYAASNFNVFIDGNRGFSSIVNGYMFYRTSELNDCSLSIGHGLDVYIDDLHIRKLPDMTGTEAYAYMDGSVTYPYDSTQAPQTTNTILYSDFEEVITDNIITATFSPLHTITVNTGDIPASIFDDNGVEFMVGKNTSRSDIRLPYNHKYYIRAWFSGSALGAIMVNNEVLVNTTFSDSYNQVAYYNDQYLLVTEDTVIDIVAKPKFNVTITFPDNVSTNLFELKTTPFSDDGYSRYKFEFIKTIEGGIDYCFDLLNSYCIINGGEETIAFGNYNGMELDVDRDMDITFNMAWATQQMSELSIITTDGAGYVKLNAMHIIYPENRYYAITGLLFTIGTLSARYVNQYRIDIFDRQGALHESIPSGINTYAFKLPHAGCKVLLTQELGLAAEPTSELVAKTIDTYTGSSFIHIVNRDANPSLVVQSMHAIHNDALVPGALYRVQPGNATTQVAFANVEHSTWLLPVDIAFKYMLYPWDSEVHGRIDIGEQGVLDVNSGLYASSDTYDMLIKIILTQTSDIVSYTIQYFDGLSRTMGDTITTRLLNNHVDVDRIVISLDDAEEVAMLHTRLEVTNDTEYKVIIRGVTSNEL